VGSVFDVLLQVNTSGEESKGGWETQDAAGHDHFFRDVEALLALPALRPRGLMTMAPFYEAPEETRPTFAALRHLRDALVARFPDASWQFLSMGMTNDFEVAIEEGATHIRVGTALFGERA
jgi:PLP dependent protein